MTTITASSTIGIVLSSPSYVNPVVINSGVSITNKTGNGDAIAGYSSAWTITNAGSVGSLGTSGTSIYLAAGGVVTNQSAGVIGSFSTNTGGIYISGGPGTVTNAGSINDGVWLQSGGEVTNQSGGAILSSIVSGGYGVGLFAGGTITNAGDIRGLFDGIDVNHDGGTVTNQANGSISGQYSGVLMGLPGQVGGGGGTLINQAGGTISGDSGVFVGAGNASVINAGVIAGTFVGTVSHSAITLVVGAGISLGSGGMVTNQPGGTISGASYGVYISNGAGTVVNYGSIAGNPIAVSSISAGIDLIAGGSVTNQSGGKITGYNGIYAEYGKGTTKMTVVNSGSIGGNLASGDGIYLGIGGRVTNQGSGSISGYHGVSGQVLTVVNYGSVAGNLTTANVGAGVELHSGGAVTNQSGGAISGRFAVISDATTGGGPALTDATIVNAGDIAGNSAASSNLGAGVVVGSGGVVTNQNGANISGFIGVYGLKQAPMAPVTVVNAGVISGNTTSSSVIGAILGTTFTVNGTGVFLAAGGAVTNEVGGTISGYGGIVGSTIAASTVVNAGTIDGIGTAVGLGAGVTNRLVMAPGAVFDGTVNGGNTVGVIAVSTLELASAASSGALAGLGSQYVNFAQLTIDSGARWQLGGSDTLGVGTTLTNNGTLTLASAILHDGGTVINNGSLILDPSTLTVAALSGTGAVVIGSNSTLATQGSVSAGETIAFADGDGVLDLAFANFSGTIDGFKASDTIDLTGVTDATSGSVVNGNTLQIQRASNPPIALTLDPNQNYDGVSFAVGAGGTVTNNLDRTLSWIGSSASTAFGSAANWDDVTDGSNPAQTAPGAADTAEFTAGAGEVSGSGTVATLSFSGNGDWQVASKAALTGLSQVSIGSGSASSVSVTNGAELTAGGALSIGSGGTGILSVALGGSVAAGAMDIASLTGGSGIVSTVGAGSSISVTGQLTVGDSASAELSILNGATVSGNNADVGLNATGTGNIDIEGTGSELSLSGNLNLGDAGTGVLTLGNNTTLHVAGNLNIGANGVLNQFGGIIDPSVVNNTGRAGGKGSISASASIANSGTLFAASGTETLTAPIITGTGVLEIDNNGDLAVNVGSVVTAQTVTFTDGTGVLTIDTLGGFAATIGDSIAGDSIVVQGTSIASLSFDASTHVLTLFDPSQAQAGVLQFGTSVADQSLISVNGLTPCFVAGTWISTERGEVPVEELHVGDRVQMVLGGHAEPVIWLGHRTVNCAHHPEPRKVLPVQVKAHAFGLGRPARDLWLSPDHAIYVGEGLIPVKYLINGSSIAQVPMGEVTYYHVELPRHSVLIAEGLPTESYLDTGDRSNFTNGGGTIVLHPDFASRQREANGCAPVVVTGPELAAARRWIEMIARSTPRSTVSAAA